MHAHLLRQIMVLSILTASTVPAAAHHEWVDEVEDCLPKPFDIDDPTEDTGPACTDVILVVSGDEAPNTCMSKLPPVQPETPITGVLASPQDRHDFYALQIEDFGSEIGVEVDSLLRLDMSIPQPAFLRVWDPTCSTILAEALPNGAVSEIAQFTPSTSDAYPVEVFIGERGSTGGDPISGVTDDVECFLTNFYWACPAGIDQYRFEAFACADRPYACV